MHVKIDRIRTHVETLARFTATPGAGSTRLSFSPEYRAACEHFLESARALGLEGRLDAVGNLRICLPGRTADAPRVVLGSHLDTVIHGGDLDGVLGVVCGFEVLQVLVESGATPVAAVELIAFVEEEATSFRCPLTGSKALAGVLAGEDLKQLRNEAGESFDEVARRFGLDPDGLSSDRIRPGQVRAMLELHIEQGAVLESEGLPVGIVDNIAGSENLRVRLGGRANHAGTTPMHLRFDALACAAEMILAVEHIASGPERPDTVATVGRIHCVPNAVNVIPGRVEFSIDVRDVQQDRIESASRALREALGAIADRRGLTMEMELTGASPPRPMSGPLADRLVELARARGIAHRRMNSGALHDAAMMTHVTEVGMIFVPSIEGRSHTPRERTHWPDIECGADLLLAAVMELALAA